MVDTQLNLFIIYIIRGDYYPDYYTCNKIKVQHYAILCAGVVLHATWRSREILVEIAEGSVHWVEWDD